MISIGSWNKLSRWHLHHHCWERRCQHRQSIVSYMDSACADSGTTLEKMLANFVTFVEGWWASSNYMFMRYVVFILHAIQTKSKEKYVILTAGWMCVNILTCARLKCHLIDLLCWQKCCHFHLSVHQCHVVWVFLLNSPTVQACIDQYYS